MECGGFSRCHPAVNFILFLGAIVLCAVFWHPVWLAGTLVCAGVYFVLLRGRAAWKQLALLLPFCLVIAGVNPVFNTRGDTVLFFLFGRPYTQQALAYGVVVAGILLAMLIWFGCFHVVMTGDKVTSLFGNLLPSVSLLLVMVFRLVPEFLRKTGQIVDARRSIGKGRDAATREKVQEGGTVVSAMTSWALEGSLVTGDSMRSRGYGTGKRTSFQIYRMTVRDWILLGLELVLLSLVILAAALGQVQTVFLPFYRAAPLSWGIGVYCAFLLIPTALELWERFRIHRAIKKI